MAYATGVTPASRSIFPICSRALLFRLRVASILESSPSTFFTRVQAHQLFSTSRAPLFSSVKCSTSSLETAARISGHQAVGLIGDPSGKSLERPELDALTLEKNIAGIKNILVKILGGNARLLCDFLITTMLDFLKNVGRFARVGQMMAKESVKKRLESEQGMSYTEFSYQLLQGYDFEGVNVQIGGNDQCGNITAGTDLIRKILQTEEDRAVWLSPSMLSPYKFYQYFFSQMRKPGYVPNTAQMKLAEEVTRFAHGEEGLKEAMKATEALRPGAETKLDWNLIERGLFESKSAARRLLKQGGVYMNNERIDDENKRVEEGFILVFNCGYVSRYK
ncbi:hypothetical protein BRARA_A03929 [Brassica rapa]|uniref:Tyrosyl-tRNA synthetase n=1 Tax=Brassica campestris TaxID=3711 RepID=A0A398AW57_BRACM|nr:hypothetical protein BRARA_A03929 [Brassica rapa]